MALGDILPEGPIRRRFGSDTENDEITLQDLEDEFGEEAVQRGLAYMASLSEADANYRKKVGEKNYVREGLTGVGQSPDDAEVTEDAEKANENWQQKSKEKGLGLENGSED